MFVDISRFIQLQGHYLWKGSTINTRDWWHVYRNVPTYRGDPDQNLDAWLHNIEIVMRFDAVPEEFYACIPFLYLCGPARKWYRKYYGRLNPRRPVSWDGFQAAIVLRFKPRESREYQAFSLARRAQFTDMSDYILTFDAVYNMYPRRAILDLTWDFIQGLPTPYTDLADELLRYPPRNYAALRDRAQELETIFQSSKCRNSNACNRKSHS